MASSSASALMRPRAPAAQAPDAVLASAPAGAGGRRTVTVGKARRAADALAQGLLDLGAAPDRPGSPETDKELAEAIGGIGRGALDELVTVLSSGA